MGSHWYCSDVYYLRHYLASDSQGKPTSALKGTWVQRRIQVKEDALVLDGTGANERREALPLPKSVSFVNAYAITARAECRMPTASTDVLVVRTFSLRPSIGKASRTD